VVLSPALPPQTLGVLDPVQRVVLAEVNEILTADPRVMVTGPSELLALIFTVGWTVWTFTTTESDADPPEPIQVKV
jgi:hypothetical protein